MNQQIEASVELGAAWLASEQESNGGFPAYASALIDLPDWQPDQVNFVTALTSLALQDLDLPQVRAMRALIASYLLGQRESSDLWRYWAREAPLHDYTPCDADDTACCSLAVGDLIGSKNHRVLLANRDRLGRFYTWMLPRAEIRSLPYQWAIRSERSSAARARREELWSNSEASPLDVDVTVNANVIRYLGPDLAPQTAIDWVALVVREGTEVENDRWYRSRTSLYRSIAVSAREGVKSFVDLRELIIARIVQDAQGEGFRGDLELADALRVLRLYEAPIADCASLAETLLARQNPEGCWERSICYYGGPQESFGWASEALSTATALSALHGLDLSSLGAAPVVSKSEPQTVDAAIVPAIPETLSPEPISPEPIRPAPIREVLGLKDASIAKALARDGYVRLGLVLTADEVARGKEIFAEALRRMDRPIGDAWFHTILIPENDVRDYITQELELLLTPKIAEVVDLEQLELMRLDFSVKPSSTNDEPGPHQDYALVDERYATSLYAWIPLVDMNEFNGTLHVVPGSHRFTNLIRSLHVPSTFDEVLDSVRAAALRFDCQAGELILMVSGIIHFSPANSSGELRLAAHGMLAPSQIPLQFYFADDQTPEGKVECYEFDIEGYVKQLHQGRPDPEVELTKLLNRPPRTMTPERFQAGLEATKDVHR
ncbi:MAG: phytanoyl-CoA dioxygenase family protein [Microthrixaceae bacterium]